MNRRNFLLSAIAAPLILPNLDFQIDDKFQRWYKNVSSYIKDDQYATAAFKLLIEKEYKQIKDNIMLCPTVLVDGQPVSTKSYFLGDQWGITVPIDIYSGEAVHRLMIAKEQSLYVFHLYIPFQTLKCIDENTFQPIIKTKTRFGTVIPQNQRQ